MKRNVQERNIQDDVTAALLLRSCSPLGLQGLAITHSTVTQADVKYICDLLEPIVVANRRSSNTPRSERDRESRDNRDRDRDSRDKDGRDKDADSTTSSSNSKSSSTPGRPRGLRYLDLGFNRIGCASCAEILRAAARGDLEALDLAGNFTQRGGPFLVAVAETLVAMPPPSQSSGKSDRDDNSSDESDDGGTVGDRKSGFKNCPFKRASSPRDGVGGLFLRLPKQLSLSTCHLKHLVSTQYPC